ncbi:hypothetical protein IM816_05695 [Luteibacter flocculans]|uniref:Uncharacterized protein n=1 Tax=Luteibacter flocculans TaxID=2780091 RepID=A0ABY4T9P9_9GAMM|nr:hypothetical protein [Luteibacter flocculans]URL59589.1 hypothetical protein IM816_05695 [Luteibacter flocculans]
MAASPIYANVRDPERYQAIAAARASCTTEQVAAQFGITSGAVRAALRRVRKAKTYELFLERDDGTRQRLGLVVTHKGFTAACIGAYRKYGEFFRGLELPGWRIADNTGSCNTLETVRGLISREAVDWTDDHAELPDSV